MDDAPESLVSSSRPRNIADDHLAGMYRESPTLLVFVTSRCVALSLHYLYRSGALGANPRLRIMHHHCILSTPTVGSRRFSPVSPLLASSLLHPWSCPISTADRETGREPSGRVSSFPTLTLMSPPHILSYVRTAYVYLYQFGSRCSSFSPNYFPFRPFLLSSVSHSMPLLSVDPSGDRSV